MGLKRVTAAEEMAVNALDRALRKTMEFFYPQLKKMRLTDYKVRYWTHPRLLQQGKGSY